MEYDDIHLDRSSQHDTSERTDMVTEGRTDSRAQDRAVAQEDFYEQPVDSNFTVSVKGESSLLFNKNRPDSILTLPGVERSKDLL